MEMTASEVGELRFAVGSVHLAEPGQAGAVLAAMQQGMINNIHGTIVQPADRPGGVMEIHGKLPNGNSVVMAARFLIAGDRVYQVIILGPHIAPEVSDTFMTSFMTN